jgi:hypothetical protein
MSHATIANDTVSAIILAHKQMLHKPIWQEKPTNSNFIEASVALPVAGYVAVNLLLNYHKTQRCPKFSFAIFYHDVRIFAFDADCEHKTHGTPDGKRVKHPHIHCWKDGTDAWATEYNGIDQTNIIACWNFFCQQANITNGHDFFEHPTYDANGQMRFL